MQREIEETQNANQIQKLFPIPICNIGNQNGANNNDVISDNPINEKKKNNRKEIYGKGIEAKTIKDELGDFNISESKVYKYITSLFGRSVRFVELLGIINAIDYYLKNRMNKTLPLLSRNEKRSFPLLIKFIERNMNLILPYLQCVSLCDSSFRKISLDTK